MGRSWVNQVCMVSNQVPFRVRIAARHSALHLVVRDFSAGKPPLGYEVAPRRDGYHICDPIVPRSTRVSHLLPVFRL